MIIEHLRIRRSIRTYKTSIIDKTIQDELQEVLLRATSSRGINPWEFYFIMNKDIIRKLSYAKEHGSSFLSEASLAVVVCADSSKSDVWIEDCSIASILLQIAAEERGLGSCWIQIRNRISNGEQTSESYVKNILGISNENIRVESIISIGYPNEAKASVNKNQLDYSKIKII